MKQITDEQAAIFEALLIQNRDTAKLQKITGCSYLESINHLNYLRKPAATPSPLPETTAEDLEIEELEKALFDEPTGTPPTPGNERQEGFTQEQAAAMYRALKECREWYEHNAHTIAPNTPICFTKAFEILKTIK